MSVPCIRRLMLSFRWTYVYFASLNKDRCIDNHEMASVVIEYARANKLEGTHSVWNFQCGEKGRRRAIHFPHMISFSIYIKMNFFHYEFAWNICLIYNLHTSGRKYLWATKIGFFLLLEASKICKEIYTESMLSKTWKLSSDMQDIRLHV